MVRLLKPAASYYTRICKVAFIMLGFIQGQISLRYVPLGAVLFMGLICLSLFHSTLFKFSSSGL